MRGSTSSVAKVARYTICYYAATTITAVLLGIILVNVIKPGRGNSLGEEGSGECGRQFSEVMLAALFRREIPYALFPDLLHS